MTIQRHRGLTEPAADAAIDTACRVLRLPTLRAQFTDLADTAAREQMTYRGFLAELLMAECDDRGRRRSERRIKAACFPRQKELRTFDFEANPNITPETLNTLATCEWVRKGQPLCLIGDSGTGKSHLLIALGTEAAMAGYRVRYVLAAKLVNELVEAADDKQLTKTIARYGRVDLLCIDELGYMELDRRGAELLFQVLTEREENNSMAIASNENFSKAHMFARTCARQRRNITGSSERMWAIVRCVTAVYVIDGGRVGSLEDFWRVMGEAVNGPGGYFGQNLDAFNDCLRGGFGTPDDDDFVVEWRDHELSQGNLGYLETVRQLELRLGRCHPSNSPSVRADLQAARAGHGPTVFDWLVEIFEEQIPGRLRLG